MKPERLQAFSDGIFAILITILVLEFRLPDYQAGGLATAVLAQWPIMFAYIATYVYIAVIWLFHHDLFGRIERTDPKLNALNLLSLFLTTLLSYSMSLLAETLATSDVPDMTFAFSAYDLLALLISVSYLLLYRYTDSHGLEAGSSDAHYTSDITRYPMISTAIYAVAFLANFVNVLVGLGFLIMGIVFHCYAYWKTARATS